MKLELQVSIQGQFWSGGAICVIPEIYRECFEPIHVCSEPFTAAVTGGVTESMARRVLKIREDAAEILAKEIARLILGEMSKKDTENGY